ncbi:MAG: hypothetical protein ACRED1_13275, partial [Limisphaerales bacterium]
PGDTVGVWTFNRELHLGQFPLQEWTGNTVTHLPPQIMAFLKKQRYAKDTRFEALVPTLNEVVRNSPRLTAIIFCDGNGQVQGIPGASAINDSFKQHRRQMQKARVPFVIVLQSEFGRYVGCTISSANSITMPHFPETPAPPARPVVPPAKVLPPAPPPPAVPPIIIIGTNTGTNLTPTSSPPPPAVPQPPARIRPNLPAAPVPPANSPAPSIRMAKTNSVSPPSASIKRTNAVIFASSAKPSAGPPAAATSSPRPGDAAAKDGLFAAGAALFIAAVAAFCFLWRRARRESASLITESFKRKA